MQIRRARPSSNLYAANIHPQWNRSTMSLMHHVPFKQEMSSIIHLNHKSYNRSRNAKFRTTQNVFRRTTTWNLEGRFEFRKIINKCCSHKVSRLLFLMYKFTDVWRRRVFLVHLTSPSLQRVWIFVCIIRLALRPREIGCRLVNE